MKLRIIILLVFSLAILGCQHDPEPYSEPETQITLKLNQAYATQTREDVLLGLNWALAQIGAKNVIENVNGFSLESHLLTLHLNLLGFDEFAISELKKLNISIKNSDEYHQNKSVDVGRYVTLFLGASNHYNSITRVPHHLRDLTANYLLQQAQGFVDNSAISSHHRIIQFSKQANLNQLFVSVEIDSITGNVLEFETIEIMNNGHLKYGVFDQDSNRLTSSNSSFSIAGKPAKCMWCHESQILPLFHSQDNHTGFLPYLQLKDSLLHFQNKLMQSQSELINGIDFSQKQDHTQMELIYISFMSPSAQRLSNEWGITESEVKELLKGQDTFNNPEFPFLGTMYNRETANRFAPFQSLPTSSSVRETSKIEVNHID